MIINQCKYLGKSRDYWLIVEGLTANFKMKKTGLFTWNLNHSCIRRFNLSWTITSHFRFSIFIACSNCIARKNAGRTPYRHLVHEVICKMKSGESWFRVVSSGDHILKLIGLACRIKERIITIKRLISYTYVFLNLLIFLIFHK